MCTPAANGRALFTPTGIKYLPPKPLTLSTGGVMVASLPTWKLTSSIMPCTSASGAGSRVKMKFAAAPVVVAVLMVRV